MTLGEVSCSVTRQEIDAPPLGGPAPEPRLRDVERHLVRAAARRTPITDPLPTLTHAFQGVLRELLSPPPRHPHMG